MTLRQRIADYLDRRTAEADEEASAHGLTVTAPTRHGRVYRDPRLDALRAVREAGCTHVPAHLTYEACPLTAYAPRKVAA